VSYLQLPEGIPDFNKAVISLWFRVPQASIDTARSMYADDVTGAPMMGIIPLMVFGKRLTFKQPSLHNVPLTTHTYTSQAWSNLTCSWQTEPGFPTETEDNGSQWFFTGTEFPVEPSYIGIDCTTDQALLNVNIQMDETGAFDGSVPNVVGLSVEDLLDWQHPVDDGSCDNFPAVDENGDVLPERTQHTTATYASAADIAVGATPESFRTTNRSTGVGLPHFPGYAGPEITADHWHHLLLSFDLSTSCNVEGTYLASGEASGDEVGTVISACKMWIALDDVNLTEKALSGYWPDGSSDPNAVLSPNTFFIYRDVIAYDSFQVEPFNNGKGNMISQTGEGLTIPTGSYSPTQVPSGGEKLGLPATEDYVDFILPVEMAELQLFRDVTLDTGVEANRRAFVDADGVPVSPTEHPEIDEDTGLPVLDDDGNPVMLPPPAVELLGQTPDILLHGSGNWSRGINTGPPDDADPLDDDLDPTGLIASYKPGPSLHGPQSPEDIPEARRRAAAR